MKIIASRQCEGLAQRAYNFLKGADPDIQMQTDEMTLHIGLASDPKFRIPAAARDALYVGDGAHIGNLIASESVKALYAKDPKAVNLIPKWNGATNKWDVVAQEVKHIQQDAAPNLIEGQFLAPWFQSYFPDIFERPLLYSHASDLVKMDSGSNPWCQTMNLILADYTGGVIGPNNAGSPDGNMTQDVGSRAGMMSQQVVNMFITYSFSMEELEGAKVDGGNPFGSKMMQGKVKYADYVLQMLSDYLIYYGNADTDTIGLFNVNTIATYNAGKSLTQIFADTSDASKGSTAYQALAKIINDFFDAAYNKFDHIKIGLSTPAYNLISSIPYSNVYQPKSVIRIFEENYIAGHTKEGNIPRVEFYADPLLNANTDYNALSNDYMIITAPEIGLGPTDTRKDVIKCGMPLKKFVYPVIPGQINTQHRMLRRYCGIFAPVSESVKVIKGFGV